MTLRSYVLAALVCISFVHAARATCLLQPKDMELSSIGRIGPRDNDFFLPCNHGVYGSAKHNEPTICATVMEPTVMVLEKRCSSHAHCPHLCNFELNRCNVRSDETLALQLAPAAIYDACEALQHTTGRTYTLTLCTERGADGKPQMDFTQVLKPDNTEWGGRSVGGADGDETIDVVDAGETTFMNTNAHPPDPTGSCGGGTEGVPDNLACVQFHSIRDLRHVKVKMHRIGRCRADGAFCRGDCLNGEDNSCVAPDLVTSVHVHLHEFVDVIPEVGGGGHCANEGDAINATLKEGNLACDIDSDCVEKNVGLPTCIGVTRQPSDDKGLWSQPRRLSHSDNGGWSAWSPCSSACNGGQKTRTCSAPPPINAGLQCNHKNNTNIAQNQWHSVEECNQFSCETLRGTSADVYTDNEGGTCNSATRRNTRSPYTSDRYKAALGLPANIANPKKCYAPATGFEATSCDDNAEVCGDDDCLPILSAAFQQYDGSCNGDECVSPKECLQYELQIDMLLALADNKCTAAAGGGAAPLDEETKMELDCDGSCSCDTTLEPFPKLVERTQRTKKIKQNIRRQLQGQVVRLPSETYSIRLDRYTQSAQAALEQDILIGSDPAANWFEQELGELSDGMAMYCTEAAEYCAEYTCSVNGAVCDASNPCGPDDGMCEAKRCKQNTDCDADISCNNGGCAAGDSACESSASHDRRTCRMKWLNPDNNTVVGDVLLKYRGKCTTTGGSCACTTSPCDDTVCGTGTDNCEIVGVCRDTGVECLIDADCSGDATCLGVEYIDPIGANIETKGIKFANGTHVELNEVVELRVTSGNRDTGKIHGTAQGMRFKLSALGSVLIDGESFSEEVMEMVEHNEVQRLYSRPEWFQAYVGDNDELRASLAINTYRYEDERAESLVHFGSCMGDESFDANVELNRTSVFNADGENRVTDATITGLGNEACFAMKQLTKAALSGGVCSDVSTQVCHSDADCNVTCTSTYDKLFGAAEVDRKFYEKAANLAAGNYWKNSNGPRFCSASGTYNDPAAGELLPRLVQTGCEELDGFCGKCGTNSDACTDNDGCPPADTCNVDPAKNCTQYVYQTGETNRVDMFGLSGGSRAFRYAADVSLDDLKENCPGVTVATDINTGALTTSFKVAHEIIRPAYAVNDPLARPEYVQTCVQHGYSVSVDTNLRVVMAGEYEQALSFKVQSAKLLKCTPRNPEDRSTPGSVSDLTTPRCDKDNEDENAPAQRVQNGCRCQTLTNINEESGGLACDQSSVGFHRLQLTIRTTLKNRNVGQVFQYTGIEDARVGTSSTTRGIRVANPDFVNKVNVLRFGQSVENAPQAASEPTAAVTVTNSVVNGEVYTTQTISLETDCVDLSSPTTGGDDRCNEDTITNAQTDFSMELRLRTCSDQQCLAGGTKNDPTKITYTDDEPTVTGSDCANKCIDTRSGVSGIQWDDDNSPFFPLGITLHHEECPAEFAAGDEDTQHVAGTAKATGHLFEGIFHPSRRDSKRKDLVLQDFSRCDDDVLAKNCKNPRIINGRIEAFNDVCHGDNLKECVVDGDCDAPDVCNVTTPVDVLGELAAVKRCNGATFSETTCTLNTDCAEGACSITTATTCHIDDECPSGETCVGAEVCEEMAKATVAEASTVVAAMLSSSEAMQESWTTWLTGARICEFDSKEAAVASQTATGDGEPYGCDCDVATCGRKSGRTYKLIVNGEPFTYSDYALGSDYFHVRACKWHKWKALKSYLGANEDKYSASDFVLGANPTTTSAHSCPDVYNLLGTSSAYYDSQRPPGNNDVVGAYNDALGADCQTRKTGKCSIRCGVVGVHDFRDHLCFPGTDECPLKTVGGSEECDQCPTAPGGGIHAGCVGLTGNSLNEEDAGHFDDYLDLDCTTDDDCAGFGTCEGSNTICKVGTTVCDNGNAACIPGQCNAYEASRNCGRGKPGAQWTCDWDLNVKPDSTCRGTIVHTRPCKTNTDCGYCSQAPGTACRSDSDCAASDVCAFEKCDNGGAAWDALSFDTDYLVGVTESYWVLDMSGKMVDCAAASTPEDTLSSVDHPAQLRGGVDTRSIVVHTASADGDNAGSGSVLRVEPRHFVDETVDIATVETIAVNFQYVVDVDVALTSGADRVTFIEIFEQILEEVVAKEQHPDLVSSVYGYAIGATVSCFAVECDDSVTNALIVPSGSHKIAGQIIVAGDSEKLKYTTTADQLAAIVAELKRKVTITDLFTNCGEYFDAACDAFGIIRLPIESHLVGANVTQAAAEVAQIQRSTGLTLIDLHVHPAADEDDDDDDMLTVYAGLAVVAFGFVVYGFWCWMTPDAVPIVSGVVMSGAGAPPAAPSANLRRPQSMALGEHTSLLRRHRHR